MLSIPSFSMGFIAGFGSGFLSREIVSSSVAIIRPITKAAMKGGMMAFEKGRETLAHFTETLEDLVAEAKNEVAQPLEAEKAEEENLAAATVDVQETGTDSEKGKDRQRSHGRKERG